MFGILEQLAAEIEHTWFQIVYEIKTWPARLGFTPCVSYPQDKPTSLEPAYLSYHRPVAVVRNEQPRQTIRKPVKSKQLVKIGGQALTPDILKRLPPAFVKQLNDEIVKNAGEPLILV